MKIQENKTLKIELKGKNLELFKKAIKKISDHPAIGFVPSSRFTDKEIEMFKKLNTRINS